MKEFMEIYEDEFGMRMQLEEAEKLAEGIINLTYQLNINNNKKEKDDEGNTC